MKSSLFRFLLSLALVSFVIAAPMDNPSVSTAITNGQGKTGTKNSIYEASRIQSPSETRDNMLDDPAFIGIMTACGDDNAEILIKQQLPPFDSKKASFTVSDENNVAQVRNCVMATRAWVEGLDLNMTIRLKIIPKNPAVDERFLLEEKVFGSTNKIFIRVERITEYSNSNSDSTADARSAKALSEALKKNVALKELRLGI